MLIQKHLCLSLRIELQTLCPFNPFKKLTLTTELLALNLLKHTSLARDVRASTG